MYSFELFQERQWGYRNIIFFFLCTSPLAFLSQIWTSEREARTSTITPTSLSPHFASFSFHFPNYLFWLSSTSSSTSFLLPPLHDFRLILFYFFMLHFLLPASFSPTFRFLSRFLLFTHCSWSGSLSSSCSFCSSSYS